MWASGVFTIWATAFAWFQYPQTTQCTIPSTSHTFMSNQLVHVSIDGSMTPKKLLKPQLAVQQHSCLCNWRRVWRLKSDSPFCNQKTRVRRMREKVDGEETSTSCTLVHTDTVTWVATDLCFRQKKLVYLYLHHKSHWTTVNWQKQFCPKVVSSDWISVYQLK